MKSVVNPSAGPGLYIHLVFLQKNDGSITPPEGQRYLMVHWFRTTSD